MLRQNLLKLVTLTQSTLTCRYTQKHNYTDLYLKWKKDLYLDAIDSIHKSRRLKPIIHLKNEIAASPEGCIPISDVSKKGLRFKIHMKVLKFMRLYPAIFEQFTGPKYNMPWFRLTPEAAVLHNEEQAVYRDCMPELEERLKKLILMSVEKRLPLKIIKGMLWQLGLPNDYLRRFDDENVDGCFKVVEMGNGLKGLSVVQTEKDERILSMLQKNALRRSGQMKNISFPQFPSKDVKMKKQVLIFRGSLRKLPYISPYKECLNLRRDTELFEKRLLGMLHELLCLFVEHSCQRKRLLCLREYLGWPQNIHRMYERHPNVFYLSLKKRTCNVILKEAYYDNTGIEVHPLAKVRKKFIGLMKESKVIVKSRRVRNNLRGSGEGNLKLNLVEDETHNAGS